MMARPPGKSRDGQEVGPGRPPLHSRFRKGQSGNPKGRPKKARDIGELIDKELDQIVSVTESGKQRRLSKREILIKGLINDALKGDRKAQAMLLPYVERTREYGDQLSELDPAEIARFALRYLPRDDEESSG